MRPVVLSLASGRIAHLRSHVLSSFTFVGGFGPLHSGAGIDLCSAVKVCGSGGSGPVRVVRSGAPDGSFSAKLTFCAPYETAAS